MDKINLLNKYTCLSECWIAGERCDSISAVIINENLFSWTKCRWPTSVTRLANPLGLVNNWIRHPIWNYRVPNEFQPLNPTCYIIISYDLIWTSEKSKIRVGVIVNAVGVGFKSRVSTTFVTWTDSLRTLHAAAGAVFQSFQINLYWSTGWGWHAGIRDPASGGNILVQVDLIAIFAKTPKNAIHINKKWIHK